MARGGSGSLAQTETSTVSTARHLAQDFHRQAEATPATTALVFRDQRIDYATLRERVRGTAAGLGRRGVQPGDRVGVHLERSIEWVVATLAVLDVGAIAVPLPPDYPRRRLEDVLRLAEVSTVVTEDATHFEDAVSLRTLVRVPASGAAAHPPEAAAFILASSGSTGAPKLIQRSHASFYHRLEWTWATHPFAGDERCCQKAHITTTHSIYELFEPLLAGGTTHLLPDDDVRRLERFWERVATLGVTRLLLVPSMLRASLAVPEILQCDSLRVVVLMGEYVSATLVDAAKAALPAGCALYSIYGSTEASSTLLTDLRRVRSGEEAPLGVPIGDTRARILDHEMRPVPDGEHGRLYLSGSALFDGYVGDSAATEQVLHESAGEWLYDTRDEVKRVRGAIHYVGRVDHTIKVRGFRVDLAEVERALERVPGVESCAVVDTGGEAPSLVGYYAPEVVKTEAVASALRATLPEFMVPSRLIGLPALPLTASHKVDRQRLATLQDTEATAPEFSGDEARLADAWERALGHRSFARDDSFFQVGGTSLTVFSLVRSLREDWGTSAFSEATVYARPTLAAQAEHLEALRRGAASEDEATVLVRLRRDGEAKVFFVSSAGGTLGAYNRVVENFPGWTVFGVRDPYLVGGREAREPFARWVSRYVDAIDAARDEGPVRLVAYSSAGVFGIEIASQLHARGIDAPLVLIDPLALEFRDRRSFGYWSLRATYSRPSFRAVARALGACRALLPPPAASSRWAWEAPRGEGALHDAGHLLQLSALFELNSGAPVAMSDDDLSWTQPEHFFSVFASRMREHLPDLEMEALRRIAEQYLLQVDAQHAYRIPSHSGPVLLLEPESNYAGLVANHLRARLAALRAVRVPLGRPTGREREISRRFGALAPHYRCMRDPRFTRIAARHIRSFLKPQADWGRRQGSAVGTDPETSIRVEARQESLDVLIEPERIGDSNPK